MVLSMAQLHSLGHSHQTEVKQNFPVMYCHWYQHCCHMMLTLSSMAPLCSLGEDKWNKMWYDFGHVMLIAPVPAPYYTVGIVNSTVLFVRSWWLKEGATWLVCQHWHHMAWMASPIILLYLLVQDDWNEIQHVFFCHLTLLALASESESCDVSGIVNSTIVFIQSRQLEQCAT